MPHSWASWAPLSYGCSRSGDRNSCPQRKPRPAWMMHISQSGAENFECRCSDVLKRSSSYRCIPQGLSMALDELPRSPGGLNPITRKSRNELLSCGISEGGRIARKHRPLRPNDCDRAAFGRNRRKMCAICMRNYKISSSLTGAPLTLVKQRGHETRPDESGSIGVLARSR